MTDTRYVYGADCMWHGSISEIGKREGLPCCPHCKGMLLETATPNIWWDQVDRIGPIYREFVEWLHDNHRPMPWQKAAIEWQELTGKKLEISV